MPGISVHPVALTSVDGPVELLKGDASWASRLGDPGKNADGTVIVPGRTLRTILGEYGIDHVDLLKLDVEGAEYDVLSSPEALDHVDEIIGEIHDDLLPVSRETLLATLEGYEVDVLMSARDRLLHAWRPVAAPEATT
jgi:hypothetical protein